MRDTRHSHPHGVDAGPRASPAFDGLASFDPSGSLASQQVEEMVDAWRRGERPGAEEILARHPELGDEATIRLIFEELCLRQEAGMVVDPAVIAQRFPRWWAELEILLDCRAMMQAGPAPAVLPGPGEALAEFRLLAELGRGVSGKVYLATQPALADRPVVLKVTPCGREEHLSLAQMQHMNIVPLYSAQVLHDRHLQVLCMPFLGGATLAQVLDLLKDRHPAGRTGSHIVDALDQFQARLPVSLPARGPFRSYLAHSPYVEAICWIGVCLADGLQYAHDRNFVHMDIKPSNVLLAGDGQPMLLDFHLAREPIDPGGPSPAWMGGTPGYMAPEQAEAMNAVCAGRAVPNAVDGRADLFALGLLLYEALGGPWPKSCGDAVPPLHRCNARVSPGLSDIIHRCLRPKPCDRYPDAAALAADLRRHLDGLPLRGVPNRSPAERWRKWRRRRPHALPRSLIRLASVLTAAAAAALLWAAYRQRVHEVRSALSEGRAFLVGQHYPEATRALKQGLVLAEYLPAVGPYRRELGDGLARARREAKASDLHHLAELIRFRYGIDPPPPEEAQALIRRGQAIWQARGRLMTPIGGRLESEVERRIRTDLLDFALAWSSLRVRLASASGADEARREALRVLDEAADLLGPSPAIDHERRSYAGPTGLAGSAPAPAFKPRSAWEHCDLGKSYLRSGEIVPAAEQFQHGLGLRPQDFWLNFYQGLCAHRLGRFEDAVNAFRVCIALSPETAECYYNRALAQAGRGHTEEAIGDYSHALQRNPSLTAAALNRGILHFHAGRLAEAADDLCRALATAPGRVDRGIIHYNFALVDMARGDRPAALAHLEAAVDSGHEGALRLRTRLQPSSDEPARPR